MLLNKSPIAVKIPFCSNEGYKVDYSNFIFECYTSFFTSFTY